MTRSFKKEIVDEVMEHFKDALNEQRYGAATAIVLLQALADHGALSEEAYEPAPLEIFYCPDCLQACGEKTYHKSSLCKGDHILMREVKD